MSDINIRRLKKVQDYLIRLDVLPIYEAECKSLPELYYMLAKKVNEIINNLEAYEVNVLSITQERLDKLDYVLSEGIYDEVGRIMEDLVDSGELNEIIKDKVFTELNNYMQEIAYIVKAPTGDVVADTLAIQTMLDKADGNTRVVLRFPSGDYNLNTLYIKRNTTIEMTKATKITYVDTYENGKLIPILFMNARPYVDAPQGYDGEGNIEINGGVIYAPSTLCLCHGENITIKNMRIIDTSSDHAIQIGGCKNVKIENCEFIGKAQSVDSRNYVEQIQIDWISYSGQPYWAENSAIYDGTVNDNIVVERCNFEPQVYGDNIYLYTAIGSHSSDGDLKHKNIIIRECKVKGFQYSAFVVSRMENVLVENNNVETLAQTDCMQVKDSKNVIVRGNRLNGGKRAIFIPRNEIVVVNDNICNGINGDDVITVRESETVTINNNSLNNCVAVEALIMVRGTNNIIITNNTDNGCTCTGNLFAHIYKGSNVEAVNGGVVKNNITSMTQLTLGSDVGKIINDCVGEVLWKGELKVGESIDLSDNVNKFEGLVITLQCYGDIKRNLVFTSNQWQFREVNVADGQIIGLEAVLTLNNNSVAFTSQNVVLVSTDGVLNHDYDIIIKNIAGYRKAY